MYEILLNYSILNLLSPIYCILAIASEYPSQYIHHTKEVGSRLDSIRLCRKNQKCLITFQLCHAFFIRLGAKIINTCWKKLFTYPVHKNCMKYLIIH